MPVDTKHDDYGVRARQWARIRAIAEGADAVKQANLLPTLDGATLTAQESYRARAMFYNATARTVAGLVGAVFRRPPQITWPEGLDAQRDNITRTGMPLVSFAKRTVEEVIQTGRFGVLVDAPTGTEAGDDAPYLCGYTAENIWNWRETVVDGRPLLA
jgi:hypothetical protein